MGRAIQFAPAMRPEAVKIHGSVKMQLCDANGCVREKDYPFSAALRRRARGGRQDNGRSDADCGFLVAKRRGARCCRRSAVHSAWRRRADAGRHRNRRRTAASKPVASAAVETTRAAAGAEIDWLPFTSAAELKQIVGPSFDIEQIRENVRKEGQSLGLLGAIFAGFVGGLILNIMPCVLPVIGLKILSFVEQSGHNRRKALMLNVWYSLGLLAVFLILASLAVGPQRLGWGELFGRAWFTVTLTAVVFVMALSFMGVWEVSLPTFMARGKTGELAAQEGAVGAFFKGVLTTFLATPCSAPFLTPALVWAAAQPAWLTYAVFLSAGLGMASPYLLVGTSPSCFASSPSRARGWRPSRSSWALSSWARSFIFLQC